MIGEPEVQVRQIKTCLKIVVGAAFACILSTQAHAAALETSGELRARGWWLDDYLKSGQLVEFWDQRLRVNFDLNVGEQTGVHARADILEGQWGDNSAKTPIAFDEAYARFVLPGTPLRFTVGRQDVSWGPGYWTQEDSRDRFAVGLKLDPVKVLVAYDKMAEGFTPAGDTHDSQAWAIGAIADAAGFKFGLLAVYLKDGSRLRFPTGDLSYWVSGLYAIGKLGPVDTRVEVVYGTGTIDRTGIDDLDVRGIGAYAGASLPLGPVSVTLEGAYAGGDDPATIDRNEGFFSADYQGPFTSIIFYNTMDIAGFAGSVQSSSPEADFSVRNARAGKLGASFAPLPRLTLTGAALYASADQTWPGVDKTLGWEFDLVAVYGITENVSLTAGVGYAVLGDYWNSNWAGAATGGEPENPLGGMVVLTTTF